MGIGYINMGKLMYIIRTFYMGIPIVGRHIYKIHRHAHVEDVWATQCILYVSCYVGIPNLGIPRHTPIIAQWTWRPLFLHGRCYRIL